MEGSSQDDRPIPAIGPTRRQFLAWNAGLAIVGANGGPALALAGAPRDPRLVAIRLGGAGRGSGGSAIGMPAGRGLAPSSVEVSAHGWPQDWLGRAALLHRPLLPIAIGPRPPGFSPTCPALRTIDRDVLTGIDAPVLAGLLVAAPGRCVLTAASASLFQAARPMSGDARTGAALGRLLAEPSGPRNASLRLDRGDTSALERFLAGLGEGLGPAWRDCLIIVFDGRDAGPARLFGGARDATLERPGYASLSEAVLAGHCGIPVAALRGEGVA